MVLACPSVQIVYTPVGSTRNSRIEDGPSNTVIPNRLLIVVLDSGLELSMAINAVRDIVVSSVVLACTTSSCTEVGLSIRYTPVDMKVQQYTLLFGTTKPH
ncbi:MAG: hypothetical protein SGJ05_04910 [bacterium]|nr:hypothetical protein [bacterium]